MGVVGDDDCGDAALAGVEDHPHDRLAVRRVERARRLVGQEEMALADDGAGDRDPLALAAGELVGIVAGPIGEAELLERGHAGDRAPYAPECRRARAAATTFSSGGQTREQVEVLEDVADGPPAKARLVVSRHRSTATLPSMRTSPLVGSSRLPAIVSKRRLARSRRTHHRDEMALVDGEVDALEGVDGGLALAVGLGDVVEFEQAHRLLDRPSHSRCSNRAVVHRRVYAVYYQNLLMSRAFRIQQLLIAPAATERVSDADWARAAPRAVPRGSAAASSDPRLARRGGRPPGPPRRRAGRRG